jgi:hypothetical protein
MRAIPTLIFAASAMSLLAGAAAAQTRESVLGALGGGGALGRSGGPLGMSNDLVCRVKGPDDGVHSVEQSARYRLRTAGFSTAPIRLATSYTYASSVTTPISGLGNGKAGIKSTISGDPAIATPEYSFYVNFVMTTAKVNFRRPKIVFRAGGRVLGEANAYVSNRPVDSYNRVPTTGFEAPLPPAPVAARSPLTIEVVELDGQRRRLATATFPTPYDLKAWVIANPPPNPVDPATGAIRRPYPPGCR